MTTNDVALIGAIIPGTVAIVAATTYAIVSRFPVNEDEEASEREQDERRIRRGAI
jgi:hypothetical protein